MKTSIHTITRRFLLAFLLLPGVAVMMPACGESEPPELARGAQVVENMLRPSILSRMAFCVAFPDGTPSQFVSYLFSEMGAAEWPPSEEWASDAEREQMELIGLVLAPKGVAFVPLRPDPGRGKQIVLRFDDDRGVVIADAYLDPGGRPVFTREWKLPRVTPAPGIELLYESNRDMGLKAQSF